MVVLIVAGVLAFLKININQSIEGLCSAECLDLIPFFGLQPQQTQGMIEELEVSLLRTAGTFWSHGEKP